MVREHIRQRLFELLASDTATWPAVDVVALTDETSLLNDVAFDSLQLLDLIVAIENAFGFQAQTEHLNMDMFDRIGSVVDFIVDSLGATRPTEGGVNAAHIA